MKVATVSSSDKDIWAPAFASRKTRHLDAFVLFNQSDDAVDVTIRISGAASRHFAVTRTSFDRDIENYRRWNDLEAEDRKIEYTAPAMSVTTFYGR